MSQSDGSQQPEAKALGADLGEDERSRVNAVYDECQRTNAVPDELATLNSDNERIATLLVRQAELRRDRLVATLDLLRFWRDRGPHPLFEPEAEQLFDAADAVHHLDELQRWADDGLAECRRLSDRMLADESLMRTESFNDELVAQVKDVAAPLLALEQAAAAVGNRVAALWAEQQMFAMQKAGERGGVQVTQERRDDGSRVTTFTFDRSRRPWWRRLLDRLGR